jgi:hypothetical protein
VIRKIIYQISKNNVIVKEKACRVFDEIDHPVGGKLQPFYFVIKQVLEKYVV